MTFLNNPFLITAFLAGLLASIPCGIVGSYVVVKRIVFIAGSIAHSVLGGMGFFLWLGLEPLYGALLAAILSAFLIGIIHMKFKERVDTAIAAIWATGMALGVIFVSLTPGYNTELLNFLFGNILWVTRADLLVLSALAIITLILAVIFHERFQAICFDEEQATLQGVPVKSIYFLLLILIALSVVLLIQIVGAILLIALLALPPALANRFTANLSKMITLAIILTAAFSTLGIYASYLLNWPPGATICLFTALLYVLVLPVRLRQHA